MICRKCLRVDNLMSEKKWKKMIENGRSEENLRENERE